MRRSTCGCAARTLRFDDLRRDYREVRTVYLVLLEGRMAVIIFTHRSFPVRSFQCARQMQESSCDLVNIFLDELIRPNLARADANMIKPEEYVEITEITETVSPVL